LKDFNDGNGLQIKGKYSGYDAALKYDYLEGTNGSELGILATDVGKDYVQYWYA
jgi:hypothetical protein